MRFADLKKRLTTSAVAIGAIALILFLSEYLFIKILVALLLALLSATAVIEYSHFLEKKGVVLPKRPLVIFAALLTLSFSLPLQAAPLIMAVLLIFCIFCMQMKKVHGSIVRIATSFFALFYICVPLGLLFRILYPGGGLGPLGNGPFWLLYLLAVTKITDIAAYFGGKILGRRKLASNISPGKTVEGTVVGVSAAILLSVLFSFYSDALPLISALVLGLFIGTFGVLGDLAESLLKRDAKVKDSNRLPGLGGALDMVDALLFTTPLFYVVMGYIT
ncbi:MAG: CDP-archaeol synthase [Candidatus Algichlamydia australiensis]|nr:CDP-archaeol synthase [Chlamydiales bacterium]